MVVEVFFENTEFSQKLDKGIHGLLLSERDKLFALGCECRINRSRRNVVEVVADGLQRDPEQKLHHPVFLCRTARLFAKTAI
jgi:hypothetical protein